MNDGNRKLNPDRDQEVTQTKRQKTAQIGSQPGHEHRPRQTYGNQSKRLATRIKDMATNTNATRSNRAQTNLVPQVTHYHPNKETGHETKKQPNEPSRQTGSCSS